MESSSADAQHLSEMTKSIYEDAVESVTFAKNISNIDDRLSEIMASMYDGLKTGHHAVTNDELKSAIQKAAMAHKDWLANMNKIVDTMRIMPIQTNPTKCAFGHFYKAIQVDNSKIAEDWRKVGSLHNTFHTMGDVIITSVKEKNVDKARIQLEETTAISATLSFSLHSSVSQRLSL